jgi:hypothetical protein
MGSLTSVLLISVVLVIATVVYLVPVFQRRGQVGVCASLELTPQDGWRLLNLAVVNRYDAKVWVERVAFVLTNLDADMQSGPASSSGALDVREFVRSGEALRVSVIEAVYNAAGKPQGVYTFRFSAAVSYRLGDAWLDSETPAYQVEMVRLSSMRLRRVRPTAQTQGVASDAETPNPRTLLGSTAEGRPSESQTSAAEDLKRSLHSA